MFCFSYCLDQTKINDNLMGTVGLYSYLRSYTLIYSGDYRAYETN